jgi:hypothetical protein
MPTRTAGFGNRDRFELNGKIIGLHWAAGLIVLRECRQWLHNVALGGSIPLQPAPSLGKSNLWRIVVSETPFLGNLATAAAFGQVSESATTWQIFRKIEYAAGMPQDILSTARDQAEQSHPQALQWVSPPTCPAPRIFHRWPGVWRNGQTYLRHAESRTNWKNEGICHHKMATKRDSTG